jgi:hypothetical protein
MERRNAGVKAISVGTAPMRNLRMTEGIHGREWTRRVLAAAGVQGEVQGRLVTSPKRVRDPHRLGSTAPSRHLLLERRRRPLP